MEAKLFISRWKRGSRLAELFETLGTDIADTLGGRSCDAALVFVSEGYEEDAGDCLRDFQTQLGARHMLACNANGVVCEKKEIEMEPAVAVLAMHLPGVKVAPFTLSAETLEKIRVGTDFSRELGVPAAESPNFICVADSMTCDVVKLLALFNGAYRGRPVAGGLASGTVVGADNWLYLDGGLLHEGSAGLALSGEVRFDIAVSQGCRPIGDTYAITRAEENVLYELAGRPPMEVMGGLYAKLPPQDQELAKHSLFVGLAMDERKSELRRGDFLIRTIMGVDEASGAMSIGEMLEVGQTLQFHLRDAHTSREDLKLMLKGLPEAGAPGSAGALLVSCCGRGLGLYGEPDHDVSLIQSARGPLALAGFFANGEFGPVQNINYVHGYTSSLTVIR